MLTGYLPTLPDDTMLSAGVLYATRNGVYQPIGVTDGAPDYDAGIELGEIMFDNRAPSRLKGLTRRVGVSAVIKGTAKEFGSSTSGGQIALWEPGSSENTASGITTVTPKRIGAMYAPGDYLVDFRWIFERASGGYACIYAPCAIVRKWGNKGQDKKEAQFAFEIECIGDPVNDLGLLPYTIERRLTLPTATPVIPTNPTTPAQLQAAVNAAGPGTTGATRRLHYVKGTARQTILANGNAGLTSPGTNSSTGFWLTKWDDELNPGLGNHFRPTATINGGNGAECLADGTLVGEGLELPATVMDALLALAHHDHGSKAGAVSPDVDTTIVGSDGLYQVLVDRSAGVTIGGIWKLRAGTLLVSYGEGGDPNRVIVDSDEIGNWEALRQVSALFGAWASFGVGTQILPSSKWFVTAAANLPSNFSISRFDRDLIHDDVNGIYVNRSGDPMATGRRLRLLVNDGNVANADTAVSEFYLDTGRANAAQQKLMCDWAAARYAVWTDTRTRAAWWLGDSFQSPYQSRDIVANITTGGHGLPPLADCAMTVFARSGNNVSDYQFPFLYFLQDCDFSARAKVAVMWGEWLNDSAGETAAQQLVRNYYGLDFVRAINAKIKACIMNLAWCRDDAGRPTNDPAIENDLNANAVSSHGAQFVLNMLHNQFYNAYNYGGGTPATQVDLLWNGADSHPSGQGLDYQDAFYQYAFLRLLGDDVSNKTVSVDPSVDHVSLSAGTPTATPTWVAHLADLTTPATGKTISFAMMKMIGGVPTPDTSVATVNASTGLITRVAPGTAYVLATSNDGAEGVCGVVCS